MVPRGDLLPILVAVPFAAPIGLAGARRVPLTRRAD
jgi:hypothetical protein